MHTIIPKIAIILLILNCVLIANSANPVSYTTDNKIPHKVGAMVGDILLKIVDDNLLHNLLVEDANFSLYLIVDKNGDILKVINRSKGVSDKIVSEFISFIKKNNTEFYFWIEPTGKLKTKYDYINDIKYYKFPLLIHFGFLRGLPKIPLIRNYERSIKLKLPLPMPTREEIQKILNKYKDIKIETSRDFGITEKDYIEDPQRKKDILQQK